MMRQQNLDFGEEGAKLSPKSQKQQDKNHDHAGEQQFAENQKPIRPLHKDHDEQAESKPLKCCSCGSKQQYAGHEMKDSSSQPLAKCNSYATVLILVIALLCLNSAIIVGTTYLMNRNASSNSSKDDPPKSLRVQGTAAPCSDTNEAPLSPKPSLEIFTEGWVDFDFPKLVYSFPYYDLDEVVIPFNSTIPNTTQASFVKIVVLQKSAGQPGWNQMFTRIRTVNGKAVYTHWLHAVAAGHSSGFAQTFILPISQTREFRIKGYNKAKNHIFANFYITSYKP